MLYQNGLHKLVLVYCLNICGINWILPVLLRVLLRDLNCVLGKLTPPTSSIQCQTKGTKLYQTNIIRLLPLALLNMHFVTTQTATNSWYFPV